MKRIRSSLAALPLLAVAAACSDAAMPAAPEALAPLLSQSADGSNRYIVVLNEGANPRSVAAIAGVTPQYVYTTAVNGFAGTLNAGQLNALRHNPNVSYVEADVAVQASTLQSGATWGLDRIDQASLPLSGTFSYTRTGAGVRAYIVDTGIRFTHTEFGGRATSGYDAVDGGAADDCNGHGTHVAGTVGGCTYGVAKGVSLVAVRVLDCAGSGTTAGVIAGVDWVANNAVKPAVANLSLGGGANTTLDNAVKNAVAKGVTFVVAAGNGNFLGIAANACNYSPARVPEAITVGATTSTDAKASYSNYGTCVDLFAPGSSITSSWYQNDTQTSTISGTSMASPHVAGVAALYLQGNTTASPATVSGAITAGATLNKVTSPGSGSPNRLLFTAY
ncbi:S8 family peptidase [Longimicrobium sp.]|uniref:S8 family peptidase n=1 Tax=Longimicrobium sp. TaxID=2029185 RepID=UPI002E37D82C|nr:S8 family peptidase [Longimicrobium sp.]HEX6040317.1 S8 family peptidase [Longimicrobium sp.]